MPRQPVRVGEDSSREEAGERTKRKERRRRRRKSVGETLGVTPERTQRRHLREAAALHDAASAAAAIIDAMAVEPSSKTKPKKGKSRKKVVKRAAKAATVAPEMSPAFKDESSFFWNTIEAFNTPIGAGDDAWLWGATTSEEVGKEEDYEWETKYPEKASVDGQSVLIEQSDDEDDPEDSDDRSFLKGEHEEASRNNCPTTDEEEFADMSDSNDSLLDGGESSDTVSGDDDPKPRKLPTKKTPKAKRKGAGKGPDPDPSDSSSSEEDDTEDSSSSDGRPEATTKWQEEEEKEETAESGTNSRGNASHFVYAAG